MKTEIAHFFKIQEADLNAEKQSLSFKDIVGSMNDGLKTAESKMNLVSKI